MAYLIQINPVGDITALRPSSGRGPDLTKLGHADITRTSDITWNGEKQAWQVMFLRDGVTMTPRHMCEAGLVPTALSFGGGVQWDAPALFPTYEEAVDAEIKVIEHYRFAWGPGAV